MAISGGTDWELLLKPLQSMSHFYTYFYVFYVFFTVFGIMNVLTAVFCEAAARISDIDRDYVIQDQLSQWNSCAMALTQMFKDATDDQMMDRRALEAHLQKENVVGYLRFLDLDVAEALNLFDLLDWEEKGAVSVDEFVQGMMRLKGSAKGVDVATLLYENKKLYVQIAALSKFVEDNLALLSDATWGDEGSAEWIGLGPYVANEIRRNKKEKRCQRVLAKNRAQKRSRTPTSESMRVHAMNARSNILNHVSGVSLGSRSKSVSEVPHETCRSDSFDSEGSFRSQTL